MKWTINAIFQSQGFGDDYTAQINKQSQVESVKLDESLAQNEDKIVDWLLNLVADIKPEVFEYFIIRGIHHHYTTSLSTLSTL